MSNMIKKADAFEIVNHWTTAISFFLLVVSGFGFLFHIGQVGSVFGGFSQMRVIHNYAGLVFAASLLLSVFSYLGEALIFSGEDVIWLIKGGGYLSKTGKVPPQGKLNAGQKGFYLLLLLAGIVISASGLTIWLMPGIRKWLLLSHLLHNISFDLLLIAVTGHIYLATLANPGTFRIMIYGTVPLEWARKRHAKWVQKMGF